MPVETFGHATEGLQLLSWDSERASQEGVFDFYMLPVSTRGASTHHDLPTKHCCNRSLAKNYRAKLCEAISQTKARNMPL